MRLWESLDSGLYEALAREIEPLTAEIIVAVGQEIREYRRPLEGAFGRGLRVGVQRALSQFVEQLGNAVPAESDPEVYRELGRGELRAGRSLDALQAAYRLGARLSWRRLSTVARDNGAGADAISLMAEAIFAYIEEISANSVEGYAQAQANLAGERDRRRRRLAQMLMAGDSDLDEESVALVAADAGWPVPQSLAALVVDEVADVGALTSLIGGEAIAARAPAPGPPAARRGVGREEELTCVWVRDPDAPGRRRELQAALRRVQTVGALGPTTSPERASMSYRRARQTIALARSGVITSEPLLIGDEHLLELLINRDPPLLQDLADRRLRSLSGLPVGSRTRLEETLRAWLRHQGSVPAVASELHVHRQTVRYRLGRLRELLGDDLEHPRTRLELELALRAAPQPIRHGEGTEGAVSSDTQRGRRERSRGIPTDP